MTEHAKEEHVTRWEREYAHMMATSEKLEEKYQEFAEEMDNLNRTEAGRKLRQILIASMEAFKDNGFKSDSEKLDYWQGAYMAAESILQTLDNYSAVMEQVREAEALEEDDSDALVISIGGSAPLGGDYSQF